MERPFTNHNSLFVSQKHRRLDHAYTYATFLLFSYLGSRILISQNLPSVSTPRDRPLLTISEFRRLSAERTSRFYLYPEGRL